MVLTALVVQLPLALDLDNLAMSLLLALGNVAGYGYALRQPALHRYPLSMLVILGYTVSYFTLPPLGQLLGLNAVTHNLLHPIADAGYALAGMVAIIAGHLVYSRLGVLRILRTGLRKGFYEKIGFFREPRCAQFWVMALFGVAGSLASRYDTLGERSVVEATLTGLRPFVYVPYLILLVPAWSERTRVSRLHKTLLWPYTGVLAVLSFVANSRAYLLLGFASLGICYGYLVLIGRVPVPRISRRALLLGTVVSVLMAGPVSRLSMSMLLVRGDRSDLTPTELASATWRTFLEPGVAARYAALSAQLNDDPDTRESYFDNDFLNRVGNLRFVDNAVATGAMLGQDGAANFSTVEWGKVASILPTPLLRLFGSKVDKELYTSGSSGDFLLYEATGNPYAIGGFRTGSLLVNLGITFGAWWPLVLALLSAPVFAVVDALCRFERSAVSGAYWPRFNPLVVGSLFAYMFMLTSAATGTDSLTGLIGPLLRGWIQIGVLYAVAFHASRLLTLVPRGRFRP
jgi:hypothetical protein